MGRVQGQVDKSSAISYWDMPLLTCIVKGGRGTDKMNQEIRTRKRAARRKPAVNGFIAVAAGCVGGGGSFFIVHSSFSPLTSGPSPLKTPPCFSGVLHKRCRVRQA